MCKYVILFYGRNETVNKNTVELWRGMSRIDDAPIVVLMSGLKEASTNEKTGDMLQTFILRQDVSPVEAIQNGSDESICGTCRHRGTMGNRTCYVNVGKSVSAVWRSWSAGRVRPVQNLATIAAGRRVRLGTYGDPGAVPVHVWQTLLQSAVRHTGYSHLWQTLPLEYQSIVVASVDTETEYQHAKFAGWRTFRVKAEGSVTLPREISCPASEEAGKRTTCSTCTLCNGATPNDTRKDIVINAHGAIGRRVINLRQVNA